MHVPQKAVELQADETGARTNGRKQRPPSAGSARRGRLCLDAELVPGEVELWVLYLTVVLN